MTDAIKKLINCVEAGTLPEPIFHGCSAQRGHWAYVTGLDARQRTMVFQSYNGSLDAAARLHDELFPGADYSVSTSRVYVLNGYEGIADNTARAWLLAILKAKLAEVDG